MKDHEAEAAALFERSVRGLDEAAVKRLRLARRATLASAGAAKPRWQPWAGGLAAAAVLLVGLAWWWPRPASAPAVAPVAALDVASPESAGGDEEPVLAEADEDADLYAWLADTPVAADAPEQRL